jgi:hypothetical protein
MDEKAKNFYFFEAIEKTLEGKKIAKNAVDSFCSLRSGTDVMIF